MNSLNADAALIVTRLNRTMEMSSLDDLVASQAGRSVLLVDVSSSMEATLRTGERAIDALRKVVALLRDTNPVPVIAFGLGSFDRDVAVVDRVPEPAGSTPLHNGIDFCKSVNATHIVLVTDGEPDSKSAALASAAAFGGKIDVFYVGDGDGDGAAFSLALAKLTGGTANITDLYAPKALAGKIALALPAYVGDDII